jgi:hypothetical protein
VENSAMATTFIAAGLVKEWNLLYVAYKNVIEARKMLWKIISLIGQKEESKSNEE